MVVNLKGVCPYYLTYVVEKWVKYIIRNAQNKRKES